MTFYIWLSLLAICILGAMTPGPSLAVVLKHCVNNGRSHALITSWCHAIGVGIWAFATVFGLGVLVAQSAFAFELITWLGAAYLLWLGIGALRAGRAGDGLKIANSASQSLTQAGIDGAMISLLNPKLAIFFIALFSQFVSADASSTDQLIMVLTAVITDGLWYSLVTFILVKGSVLAWLQRQSHWVNRITGGIFIALAVRVVAL
ncbi:MAG: LysE family translocator [Pseudomonadales bacterium]